MENEKILKGICCEVKKLCAQQRQLLLHSRFHQGKNRMAVLGEETMCETFEEL